jgi:hypothetical protein
MPSHNKEIKSVVRCFLEQHHVLVRVDKQVLLGVAKTQHKKYFSDVRRKNVLKAMKRYSRLHHAI